MVTALRLPSLQENIRVYAVIVALVYTWTTLWLFWDLPSWLYFLTIPEILPLFAYAFTTNLLETGLILVGLNLLAALLPRAWFRASFVARSFWLLALGMGYLMAFASLLGKEEDYPAGMLSWSPLVFGLIFIVSLLLDRFPRIRALAEQIADRLTIFLYLTIPLSLISLFVVLVRNAR
ncbi:MAG TPA: hypothetical protein VK900_01450 [Anaerolineales bacterium]|nr:hypothetical protein [Anaerolineales bacterium]